MKHCMRNLQCLFILQQEEFLMQQLLIDIHWFTIEAVDLNNGTLYLIETASDITPAPDLIQYTEIFRDTYLLIYVVCSPWPGSCSYLMRCC